MVVTVMFRSLEACMRKSASNRCRRLRLGFINLSVPHMDSSGKWEAVMPYLLRVLAFRSIRASTADTSLCVGSTTTSCCLFRAQHSVKNSDVTAERPEICVETVACSAFIQSSKSWLRERGVGSDVLSEKAKYLQPLKVEAYIIFPTRDWQ